MTTPDNQRRRYWAIELGTRRHMEISAALIRGDTSTDVREDPDQYRDLESRWAELHKDLPESEPLRFIGTKSRTPNEMFELLRKSIANPEHTRGHATHVIFDDFPRLDSIEHYIRERQDLGRLPLHTNAGDLAQSLTDLRNKTGRGALEFVDAIESAYMHNRTNSLAFSLVATPYRFSDQAHLAAPDPYALPPIKWQHLSAMCVALGMWIGERFRG